MKTDKENKFEFKDNRPFKEKNIGFSTKSYVLEG
jgi:hypothetical protein